MSKILVVVSSVLLVCVYVSYAQDGNHGDQLDLSQECRTVWNTSRKSVNEWALKKWLNSIVYKDSLAAQKQGDTAKMSKLQAEGNCCLAWEKHALIEAAIKANLLNILYNPNDFYFTIGKLSPG